MHVSGVAILLGWLSWASIAAAEQVNYDLNLRSFKIGTLVINATEIGSRYRVAARITNTGLTRVIRQFSFEGQAEGRISGGALAPSRYLEKADTGKRISEVELRYPGGVPQVVRYTSPREAGPDAPAPETQGGTTDPLTGIYGLLRDVTPSQACKLDTLMFDGKRQSRLRMRPAGQADDGQPKCRGSYERLKGFTAEEVARHTRFDFDLFYAPGNAGKLQVREVIFQSIYGQSSIRRR